jgi:hypothetical protein
MKGLKSTSEKKICPTCHVEFDSCHPLKKYCSISCRNKMLSTTYKEKYGIISKKSNQERQRRLQLETDELKVAFNSLHFGLDRLEAIMSKRAIRTIRYGRANGRVSCIRDEAEREPPEREEDGKT